MKLFLSLAATGVAMIVTAQQKPVYQSGSFSVFPDRVVQGNYEAKAPGSTELTSTYASSFLLPVKNKVAFKLAIQGGDNERGFGLNHLYFIDPAKAEQTTPVFVFGKGEPEPEGEEVTLTQDVKVTFRVDMSPVFNQIREKGVYETHNKQKITADEAGHLFLAGSVLPLTWDFGILNQRKELEFSDADGDGIFELTVLFKKAVPQDGTRQDGTWKLTAGLSGYPKVSHGMVLQDALYAKALEELTQDIREDGTLMAGKQWPGVWTRDISYSIILAVAAVNPDASRTSLMAKVKNGKIIQDTGTGGSWPCSSDRMVWSLAAWEIYLTTGDKDWLRTAFAIIESSAADDEQVVFEPSGLILGETSFIDWREQSYPRWMDPKDIYHSVSLGTNVVQFETWKILGQMAKELGKKDVYSKKAEKIAKAVNQALWLEKDGYYGMYRYGRLYPSVVPKSEALGEALAVLTGLAGKERAEKVMASVPVYEFGVPTFYPQIPEMNPYHNNSVWPFVQAYFTLAGKKVGNTAVVEHGLASITRSSALFLTNKENFVASTGDYMGTEINSDRQLWSVAASLAMTYKVLFGLDYSADGLRFTPFVPKSWASERKLENLNYHGAKVSVSVSGFGEGIKSVRINGKKVSKAFIPASATGTWLVEIELNGKWPAGRINLVPHLVHPGTPVVSEEKGTLSWKPVKKAVSYSVFLNGKKSKSLTGTSWTPGKLTEVTEVQIAAVAADGTPSLLSEPVILYPGTKPAVITDIQIPGLVTEIQGYSGDGYVLLTKSENTVVPFSVTVPENGLYRVDFRYSNGSGPINTDNKCAIRTLYVSGKTAGPVVLPQRGDQNWTEWGWSSGLTLNLKKGSNPMKLVFEPWNENMNQEINTALLDQIRLIRLK